jgi:hypothetical protein
LTCSSAPAAPAAGSPRRASGVPSFPKGARAEADHRRADRVGRHVGAARSGRVPARIRRPASRAPAAAGQGRLRRSPLVATDGRSSPPAYRTRTQPRQGGPTLGTYAGSIGGRRRNSRGPAGPEPRRRLGSLVHWSRTPAPHRQSGVGRRGGRAAGRVDGRLNPRFGHVAGDSTERLALAGQVQRGSLRIG